MDAGVYLGYIAYYVKNVAATMSPSDFLGFASERLGRSVDSSLWDAPLPKVRDFARLLYKSYVVSTFVKRKPLFLARNLSGPKAMENYLRELVALDKKYGVYYDTISEDMSDAAVDTQIKKLGIDSYKRVLSLLIDNDPDVVLEAKLSGVPKPKKAPKVKAQKTEAPIKKAGAPKKSIVARPPTMASKAVVAAARRVVALQPPSLGAGKVRITVKPKTPPGKVKIAVGVPGKVVPKAKIPPKAKIAPKIKIR